MRVVRRILIAVVVLVGAAWLALLAWRQWSPDTAARRIAASAQPGDIFLYSYTTCGTCKKAKIWMALYDIPYESCYPDTDRACNQRFRALKTPGTPTWVIRGQTLIGFDREALAQAVLQPRR